VKIFFLKKKKKKNITKKLYLKGVGCGVTSPPPPGGGGGGGGRIVYPLDMRLIGIQEMAGRSG